MISKRELKKEAKGQAADVIRSSDLAELFGDTLYDLGFQPEGDWIHEALEKIQYRIIKNITR